MSKVFVAKVKFVVEAGSKYEARETIKRMLIDTFSGKLIRWDAPNMVDIEEVKGEGKCGS